MNEFIAKKIGEVAAFSRVGVELLDKGSDALSEPLGEATLGDVAAQLEDQYQQAAGLVKGEAKATMEAKAAATGKKLSGMAETYIGDQWDNPAEIMEWLGFFEGAALVHWQLVGGAAEALADNQLAKLSQAAIALHQSLLESVAEALRQLGHQRALSK